MKSPRTWTVYILKLSNGKHYVGCTNDLGQRLIRHEKGSCAYTKDALPLQLISYFTFFDKYKAYAFEKYLKSGSGRAFMYKRLV